MRSMTGYASLSRSNDHFDVFMEIKSVNSRYFEFRLKSSNYFNELEIEFKNRVMEFLERGKVELYIKVIEKTAENFAIITNLELVDKYAQALKEIAAHTDISPTIAMNDFTRLEGVLSLERTDNSQELEQLTRSMLDELLQRLAGMMDTEGRKTAEDIQASLDGITRSLGIIEGRYPQALEEYKEALRQRIQDLVGSSYDENRLLMEVELVASRSAINEETVRLNSHLEQMRRIVQGQAKGDSKKMDFICQEMNRETNTIGSKSTDYQITEQTIAIKGDIEKIREQLRNII